MWSHEGAILSQPCNPSEHTVVQWYSLVLERFWVQGQILSTYQPHVKENGASMKDNFPQKPTTGTAAATFPSSTALLFSVAATA